MLAHRYPLLLGALCLAQSAHAMTPLEGNAGLANFPTIYQLLAADQGKMSLVSDPKGVITNKKFAQLTLIDNGSNAFQQTVVTPQNPNPSSFINDGRRWYGFSIFIPDDWVTNNVPVKIAEIDSSNSNLPPPVAFYINNQDIQAVLSANHRDPSSSDPPTAANTQSRSFTLMPATKGKWNCITIRMDWNSALRNGEMRVWVNREAQDSYIALRTHNTYQGVTYIPRVGMSVNGALGAGVTQRKVVVDAIVLGDGSVWPDPIQAAQPCPTPAQ